MVLSIPTSELLGAPDCPACRVRLTGALQALGGVQTASVGQDTRIQAAATEAPKDLERAARAAAARVSEAVNHREYLVSGMDCADCVRKVDAAVGALDGVSARQVNLGTGRLLIELDAKLLSEAGLKAAIEPLGYRLQAITGAAPALPSTARLDPRFLKAALAGLAWLSLAALAPLLGKAAPFGFAALALAGVVPIARRAVTSLARRGALGMNHLMTLAVLGAIVAGDTAEAAAVVALFLFGEALEAYAARLARRGVSALGSLLPDQAERLTASGAMLMPTGDLQVGNVVRVRAGDRLPGDGVIESGRANVDESLLTGESQPVSRAPGETVAAGSINLDGLLTVRLTRASAENTVSRLARLVSGAAASKAPISRLTDRFAARFVPVVLMLALATAVVPPLLGGAWATWTYRALGLLLVGCPCALVLSTPAAVSAAIAAAARRGWLVREASALEALARAKHAVFDKTGTLTVGRPALVALNLLADVEAGEVLSAAASLESASRHPLARAVLNAADERGLNWPEATSLRNEAGVGIYGAVNARAWALVRPEAVEGGARSDELTRAIGESSARGSSSAVVIRDGRAVALLEFQDAPRETAPAAVSTLVRQGLEVSVLSGDTDAAVARLAGSLGLNYRAAVTPQEKLDRVRELDAKGGVIMVGDGLNDAPALASATVGIALGGGLHAALDAAGVTVPSSDLNAVPGLVGLSRRTVAVIRQNIALAVGLKAVVAVTTLLGLTGLSLAVLSDTGATVLVTLNSLRLLARRSR